ncbi:MAG: VacB/RNase II family 3'-5' exoribonuclease, partial [Hyphomicrobiales bacterium]|nr:VacB/RNase II family 3'-5' exoribonuclease [Hyphomicrobiales bacterium]
MALLRLTGRTGDGDIRASYESRQIDGILLPSGSKRGAWRDLGTLKDGDTVLARLTWNDSGDSFTASVIRRLSQERPPILGLFRREGEANLLDPVDKRDRNRYRISAKHAGGARDGDLVTAEILPGGRHAPRQAKVTANHGKLETRAGLSAIAIHEHGLPLSFSKETLEEVAALQAIEYAGGEKDARLDLRDVPLVTIDPRDARDHDDAVWAKADDHPKNPGGWTVFVAIADVSAYVPPGSALDRDARKRGNSTYFPDRVLPMLPERLSADLCSLRAGEERPCVVARMVFDKNGRKRSHSFVRAMMKSAAFLTYEQAQAAIDGKPDDICRGLLESTLKPLWGAYRALAKAREQRQPLELEMPEYRIRIEKSGKITNIEPSERLDAHRLVEEFMIAANSAVAQELRGHLLIHRNHEPPAQEKSEQLRQFLRALHLRARVQSSPKPKDFNDILRRIDDEDMQAIIGEAILRSQTQAFYGIDPLGHFGLQLRDYAHFTSPIRRYADLTVHRSLLSLLANEKKKQAGLEETAAHISETERRSVAAERDTAARYMAVCFSERIGERMSGRITGVSRAGLFIRPHASAADGFAPVARLPGGYYRFEPSRFAMVGHSRGQAYRIGDTVRVEVTEANPLTGGLILDVLPGKS